MSSLRQIAANRRNADKSTGPVTPEGKERSRANALRHGLTAETVIARLEDTEDYQAFEVAVISDYDAQSAVERELALRLASILWRLRRTTGIESALFETVSAEPDTSESGAPDQSPPKPPLVVVGSHSLKENQLRANAERNPDASAEQERSSNPKTGIAECFLRLAALQTFPLDRLSRYEHTLWRQANQIVFALEAMRTRARPQGRLRFPCMLRSGRR
jgi:hypothetical protein